MKIALLGYGTVGRGVDRIISDRVPDIEVARILELPERICDARMCSDIDAILDDESVEVVVECMGGIEPAHTYLTSALGRGKHVVTSNKAVVAAYLDEFLGLARSQGVAFLFEASVGGGIPWLASIDKVRRIDEVSSFSGIMNGTTNYIIDCMAREGLGFGQALKRAQELGYAERDPTADITGEDVRNKTIITASMAFGGMCTREVPTLGIQTITKGDLDLFAARGLRVKLLGHGVAVDGRYAVAVEPVAVAIDSLEAQVPTNFNLVTLVGTTIGELKFYGQGAGSLPTGNAIVQDVLDVAAGRRTSARPGRELTLDEGLLRSDYVVRSVVAPEGATELSGVGAHGGLWVVRDALPREMCEKMRTVWIEDASAFVAAVPKEVVR